MAVDSQSKAIARLIYSIAGLVQQSAYVDNLRPAQWSALRFFNEVNPESATVIAFAQHHAKTRGTASRTVSALVAKGLLERKERSDDARSHYLVLTPAGQTVMENDPIHLLEAAVSDLDPDIRDQLATGLREIGVTFLRRGES